MNILFLATRWGPRFGGINAFNRDLAIGVAQELGVNGKIFSAVLDPTDAEIADARKNKVTIVPIRNKHGGDAFDHSWAQEIVAWLNQRGDKIDWWIGHDLTSGDAALKAAQIATGRAALIHHMSYIAYQGYKHDQSAEAAEKHKRQQNLFKNRTELFAVGPLLQRSCRELAGSRRKVTRLIPGFPRVPKDAAPTEAVVAITFGRMDYASDRIKQGRLAVAGFSQAVRDATVEDVRLRNGRMFVVGLDSNLKDEEREIIAESERIAGRVVNILALPYDNDHPSLLRRLSQANLAFMLSWHEGFGLTGWEAIGAEIPLIVSRQSGVFELIAEVLQDPGIACVFPIDVHGRRGIKDTLNYTVEDVAAVSSAVHRFSDDPARFKKNARFLKTMLEERLGCTWRLTARTFLAGLAHPAANFKAAPQDGRRWGMVDTAQTGFITDEPENAVPQCAELTVSTTQGSTPESFYLLPELRFGRAEFRIEDLVVQYGIAEASLRLFLHSCRIPPGTRLGDSREAHPDVSALGKNTWQIRGPKEGGMLMRRVLGTEPICRLEAGANVPARVVCEVTCFARHVVYEFEGSDGRYISVNEARVLELFFSQCLNVQDGMVTLSRAGISNGAQSS